MTLPFKDYLSEFMDSRNKQYAANASLEARDAEVFDGATGTAGLFSGQDAFRKPGQPRNQPLCQMPL